MSNASTPTFRIRVLDPTTGDVVIDPLVHLGCDFERRGMVPGATGQNLVGSFNIDLPPPGSSLYRTNIDDLLKLAYNQRVEFYLGEEGGDPKFTGVIRGLPRALDNYKITGVDSLNLLQQSRTGRTEYVKALTDQVAALGLRAYQKIFGDDFSGNFGALADNYTATGAWSENVADEGLTTATISDTAADDYLVGTLPWTGSAYVDCVVRCWFHILATTTIASTTAVGIIAASDGAAANLVEGQLLLTCVSATEWDVDVILTRKVAGVYTIAKRVTMVLKLPTNLFRCQLQLVGKKGTFSAGTFTPSPTGADYMWRLLVNGVDSNCYVVQVGASIGGAIGIHWKSAAGGGPQLWANRLVFRNRANVFQQGNWTAGVRSIAQYFSRTPMLDVLTTAAVTEGSVIAKREKAGLNNDQIDFGPVATVGQDLSTTVILEEEFNLAGASLEAQAETPASEIELQLSPGSDNAGFIEWDNLAAEDKFGILTDSVGAQNISDFLAARVLADQLASIKGNPGVAKKAEILLNPDTAWTYNPLDYVGLTSPRLGLLRAKVQVVALKYTEGKRTVDATFDSYPIDASELQLRRLWQTVDALAAGVASLSPTQGTATVYDNAYGAPNVMTCYSGYWPVDATHTLQLKFTFPRNIVMIQKVSLSFFLFAYLAGLQTTTAGVTSAGGSSHSHSVSGQTAGGTTTGGVSVLHSHGIFFNTANSGSATTIDAGGVLYNPGGGGRTAATNNDGPHTHTVPAVSVSGATSSSESTHTHSVPSASLNAPTSLQAGVGGATNVHVTIDGVDQTANLSPVGPYTTDEVELDITPYVIGGGQHTIVLSSSALGGLACQVQAFTLAKSI